MAGGLPGLLGDPVAKHVGMVLDLGRVRALAEPALEVINNPKRVIHRDVVSNVLLIITT